MCAHFSALSRSFASTAPELTWPLAPAQVAEEVRVMVAEGLHPADLIQELLLLRSGFGS